MLFAQEFVTSGILAMHCCGCGIIDIFIQADLANANSGHLGVALCLEKLVERTWGKEFVIIKICKVQMSRRSQKIQKYVANREIKFPAD